MESIKKKIKVITGTLESFMRGLTISRDMDVDKSERVNLYDLEDSERKFAADTVSAIYDEAMRTAIFVASNMLTACANDPNAMFAKKIN